jgi:predicted helicase
MEIVLGQLNEHNLEKESASLSKFYASVHTRARDVKTALGRQALITELYDKFFKSAFPKLTERLGIVYTPIEVVDFIIHSVNDVLKDHFGQTLGSKGVHILDPFTGTGTFITRLLQSGLITRDELEHKYRHEIHANEIVLLAYYIAAVNVEMVYHELRGDGLDQGETYHPFNGILLTDTFQMYEQDRDMIANLLPDNSQRRTRQKALDIRVIMGNPPYSAGQSSANDNAANLEYAQLDQAIRDSYAAHSTATLKNALYDSYIRAFRWASDRIGDAGVMAFVSGSAWIERNFADGMRKCLVEEYSDLYVFHLRGDIRKNMLSKGAAGEGQNVFGSGSMTGISIAVLVKNPNAATHGNIHFHDIGDDLSQKEKLGIIRNFRSINGIAAQGWTQITPDAQNDWLDQINPNFKKFIPIGTKDKGNKGAVVFENYSSGQKTNRDAWATNFSKSNLTRNMCATIQCYNSEVERFKREANSNIPIKEFINTDPTKISWDEAERVGVQKGRTVEFDKTSLIKQIYRPFTNQWSYYNRIFNNRVYQMPRIFPNAAAENLVIAMTGKGSRNGFSIIMSNVLPDLNMMEAGAQCFPLYLYDAPKAQNDSKAQAALFEGQEGDLARRDAITDHGLAHFQSKYPGETLTKEDLFYYIYGLLHSPDYRSRFKNNLAKALPRIPAVKTADDFWAFSQAGRRLGDLHVNFESVPPYMVTFKEGDHDLINEARDNPQDFYRVRKMKFGGSGKTKDRSTVIYKHHITLQNIPLAAYDYVVNGKPALEWVMERQVVKQDKASGIVNDANDYANETAGDLRYPMHLFQRVITVSLKTMDIVNALPKLDID